MENKTAVVYRSKTGYTKQYAEWIGDKLGADVLEGEKTSLSNLLKYDTIIYGGGLYAGGMNGVKLITKNYEALKGKKLIAFAVGLSPAREKTIDEVKNNIFKGEINEKIKFFYMRGGFELGKCTFVDKILMLMLKIQLKSIKNPDADQKGMLSVYDKPQNFTNIKYIEPLIAYVKGLEDK